MAFPAEMSWESAKMGRNSVEPTTARTPKSQTGRIAPGLSADLLAVEGNPVERIQALDDVRLVIAAGRVAVDRLDDNA